MVVGKDMPRCFVVDGVEAFVEVKVEMVYVGVQEEAGNDRVDLVCSSVVRKISILGGIY